MAKRRLRAARQAVEDAIDGLLAVAVTESERDCDWAPDDEGFYWARCCDRTWDLGATTLRDSYVKFCPYCGGLIHEVGHRAAASGQKET